MDTEAFGIRAATLDDLPALLELYRELQPDDPVLSPDAASRRMVQILNQPGMMLLVGTVEKMVVATITLVVIPNFTRNGAPYALIENVVTATAHRKRGHAGALIRHGLQAAWETGCYKVMLLSGSRNPATLDFYRNCGFVQDKTGFQVRRPAAL